MVKFSVVIPVYKAEKYLDQCVQSVLAQTHSCLEILLVDDGSPDRSGAMCDRWAAKDDRIRVLHQRNGGASAARNNGIRHATGDYILFLDSDDWWEKDIILETVARHLERVDVDVLSLNYRKSCDGVLQPTYFSEHIPSHEAPMGIGDLVRDHLWGCSPCNKVIRMSLFKSGTLFFREGITSEDMDWTLRLAIQADTFAFLNCSIMVYRQHATSVTHSVSRKSVEILRDNVAYCIRLLKEAGQEVETCLEPFVAYLYATLVYTVASLPKSDRKDLLGDIRTMQYLLARSDHPKVRLIYQCNRFLGLTATMTLLRWYIGLRKHST